MKTSPRVAHAHYAGISEKLHLRFALLLGDKPSAKARSSEELKFLSSQAALSYRAAVATDAPLTSAPTGVDLRFASAMSYGVLHEAE